MPDSTNLFVISTKYSVRMKATNKVMLQFREIAGDENQIHYNNEFATARGFEGPIVYGNLLGTMVSKLIGVELPWEGVVILRQSLDFRKPVYIGEDIELVAEVTAVHSAVHTVHFTLIFNSTSTPSFCTGQCLIKCL